MGKSEGADLDVLRKLAKRVQVDWIERQVDWTEKQVEQYREEIADVHGWDYLEVQGKENDLNYFLEWLKKGM